MATSDMLVSADTDHVTAAALVANFDGVAVDRTLIDQARLDLEDRAYTSVLPWRGQFSPELVDVLLGAYAGQGQRLLDPFVGSGTSLLRGGARRIGGFGTDVSMAAVLRARVAELCNLDERARLAVIDQARHRIGQFVSRPDDLFSRRKDGQPDTDLPLAVFGEIEDRLESVVLTNAVMIAMGDTGRRCTALGLYEALDRMELICRRLPQCEIPVSVELSDARRLNLENDAADLVLTSPPYVNVFNYHQYFRPALEALGVQPLQYAPHEIGANRKHRGNRFLTVVQYCLDMGMALLEMRRVTRPGGLTIMVVGRESNVRGARIFNSSGVYAVAVGSLGYTLVRRHERSFTSRFGTRVFEDVLVLEAAAEPLPSWDRFCRGVALGLLERARASAAAEAFAEIGQAEAQVDAVQASPLLAVPVAEACELASR